MLSYIVPCMNLLENPSALLEDARFAEILDKLAETYRYVIIDSPPLGSVADAAQIASLCDGAVLVVRAGETSRNLIKQSFQQLSRSDVPSLESSSTELRPPEEHTRNTTANTASITSSTATVSMADMARKLHRPRTNKSGYY